MLYVITSKIFIMVAVVYGNEYTSVRVNHHCIDDAHWLFRCNWMMVGIGYYAIQVNSCY
jgi:hypothetical protein